MVGYLIIYCSYAVNLNSEAACKRGGEGKHKRDMAKLCHFHHRHPL